MSNMLPNKLDEELSRENPLPGQNYFDPKAEELASEQMGRGADFFTGNLNYGIGKPGLSADNSTDPMVRALNQGWDSEYNTGAEATKTRNELTAPMRESEQKGRAAAQSGAMYQNEVQNFQEQYAFQLKRQAMLNQWKIAKARAEAGLYGAIFSGVGAAGGAILGGGGNTGGGWGQGKNGMGGNSVGTQNEGGW